MESLWFAGPDEAQRYLDDGFRMVGVGSDGGYMLQGAKAAVARLSRPSAPAG